MKRITILFFLVLSISVFAQTPTEQIRINQVGFYPNDTKHAILIDATATEFEVLDKKTNKVVLKAPVGKTKTWWASKEKATVLDFSTLQTAGQYVISVEGTGYSYPFEIKDNIFDEVSKSAARYYYLNRSSTELKEEHAGVWKHPFGHPDDQVKVHSSAATEGRPKGTLINSAGGWYDAGDYGKYIMTAGISTYSLLATYEQYPDYIKSLSLNIPESNNNIPDLLDECLYEIRWMLTMQDPTDGGVYHKLTTTGFTAMNAMPADLSTSPQRYVCGKNTNVTLDFASTMAVAHRIFKQYESEVPGLADTCLTAALKAWDWAKKNPDIAATQCPGFATGAYDDGLADDEWDWASIELFIATQDDNYLAPDLFYDTIPIPNWQNKRALGFMSLMNNPDIVPSKYVKKGAAKIKKLADKYTKRQSKSAYKVAMGAKPNDWVWGSNGTALNQSMILLTAYHSFGDQKYYDAGISNIDYALGRNATGYSFVTGFGGKPAEKPHHRLSEGDNAKDCYPGMLVGGPFLSYYNDCKNYPTDEPASRYVDEVCSYSTNEVTINWNAPFAYSLMVLEAINSKK